MAANKQIRVGPSFVSNAAANILNGTVTSLAGPVGVTLVQPVLYVKHIVLTNKTAGGVTCTLYVGTTAGSTAGTEIMGQGQTIAANSSIERYFGGSGLRLDSADFLTGIAGAASSIVFEAECEVGFQ